MAHPAPRQTGWVTETLQPSLPEASARRAAHWTVGTNHRLRTLAFLDMFAAIVLHAWNAGHGAVFWALVALHLLVYPHVVFLVARRSAHSQQAEVNNLTLDCVLFGVLMSALQYPLWIAFSVYIASTLNITISRGLRGLLRSQLAFAGGVAIGLGLFGWHPSPATGWPATWLCVLGNAGYLGAIGVVAFDRNQQLRRTREALRASELAMQERLAEIQALRDRLQEQAVRDPLTGLHNRRHLEDVFQAESARCRREHLPITLAMIDIDHFKRINDTWGHPVGDQVLVALGAHLRRAVRASDSACRYGGEEFVLLLPGIDAATAFERADHWRESFARLRVQADGAEVQATLSMGLATFPVDADSLASLLHCADQALYRAKAQGRNRVVVCGPADASPRAGAQGDPRACAV